jgi:S-adenosylmethionine synthetase
LAVLTLTSGVGSSNNLIILLHNEGIFSVFRVCKDAKTASYGHFGRDDADFTWEQPKTLKF